MGHNFIVLWSCISFLDDSKLEFHMYLLFKKIKYTYKVVIHLLQLCLDIWIQITGQIKAQIFHDK